MIVEPLGSRYLCINNSATDALSTKHLIILKTKAIMKKQFSIKSANAVKDVVKPVTKLEVSSLLGLLKEKYGSCDTNPQFTSVTRPNFSL